jgi:hypothetical protein
MPRTSRARVVHLPASRQRRYRERRDNGRAIWRVEQDVKDLEHLLETSRYLPVCVDHTHADVQAALNKFIQFLIDQERARLTRSNFEF